MSTQRTLTLAPLAVPLSAQCPCGATMPLYATDEWRLCPKCGRALRFQGRIEVTESAEEWAGKDS